MRKIYDLECECFFIASFGSCSESDLRLVLDESIEKEDSKPFKEKPSKRGRWMDDSDDSDGDARADTLKFKACKAARLAEGHDSDRGEEKEDRFGRKSDSEEVENDVNRNTKRSCLIADSNLEGGDSEPGRTEQKLADNLRMLQFVFF